MQGSTLTDAAIAKLRRRLRAAHDDVRVQAQGPLELPEPAPRLNLEARAPDKTRMFKHLCQSCCLHAAAFKTANQIKLLYLIDAYLTMSDPANPLGLFCAARALLEFNAFLYEVTRRLLEAAERTADEWRQRGERFFKVIVRARYATSDPQLVAVLQNAGIGKETLKPFNVTNCIEQLALQQGFDHVASRYDRLCDFVHHNLSSQTIAQSAMCIDTVARSPAGGRITTPKPGPVIRYEYPARVEALRAVCETLEGAVCDTDACVSWLSRCPEHPFTQQKIEEFGALRPRAPSS